MGGKKITAVKDINLKINRGEFFVFLGPSGSGKSTLLRLMSGLEKDYAGEVSFAGARRIAFVFQQFALFPWLTVFDNAALGADHRENVWRQLKLLGLAKAAAAYPRELSGGMRQRAGLARALAVEPEVIFLDEPFSEVDSFTAAALRKELLKIWRQRKITIVMVTHLVEEALELASRIAVLTPRPGQIEALVENSLPRPRQRRTPAFFRLEDKLYQLIRP